MCANFGLHILRTGFGTPTFPKNDSSDRGRERESQSDYCYIKGKTHFLNLTCSGSPTRARQDEVGERNGAQNPPLAE